MLESHRIVVVAMAATALGCEGSAGGLDAPPIANAGPDQTVGAGASVVLDGGGSRDPDGRIASYSWLQTGGSTVELARDGPVATFDAPDVSDQLAFTLIVGDEAGGVDRDVVEVRVDAAHHPVADAGADREVIAEETVQLDGSESRDPDGEIASHTWRQTRGLGVELSEPNSVTPTFVAPGRTNLLAFVLTVEDLDGKTAEDEVVIAVVENLSPIADAGPDIVAVSGETVALDASRSRDPDGQISAFNWHQVAGPPVELDVATSPRAEFELGDAPGIVEIELTVIDDRGASDTDRVRIVPGGRAPQVHISHPPPEAGFGGRTEDTVVTGWVRDPDGTEIVSVTIDGEPADLQPGIPLRFRGRARLATPAHLISVEAADEAGDRGQRTRRVQNRLGFGRGASAYDATSDVLFVFGAAGLIELDRRSGRRRLVATNANIGLRQRNAAAFDAVTRELYVVGEGRNGLLAVSVELGTSRVVSSSTVGAGPLLRDPRRMTFDAVSRQLVVLDGGDTLLEVDVDTGDRRVLSGPTRGLGERLEDPEIALLPETGNVIALQQPGYPPWRLVQVDRVSGDRTDFATYPLADVHRADELAVDASSGDIYVNSVSEVTVLDRSEGTWSWVVDEPARNPRLRGRAHFVPGERTMLMVWIDRVTELDVDSGSMRTVFDRPVGSGPTIDATIQDVEFDASTGSLLVMVRDSPPDYRIYAVDTKGGRRSQLPVAFPTHARPRSLAHHPSTGRTYAADPERGLWAVDPAAATPNLVDESAWVEVALDPTTDRIVGTVEVDGGVDWELRVFDPRSGQVTVASDRSMGLVRYERPADLVWDAARNRALVLHERGIQAVDGVTGRRPWLVELDRRHSAIALSAERDRLYLASSTDLSAVELSSGRRERVRSVGIRGGFAVDDANRIGFTAGFAVVAVELLSGESVEVSR
jgi:hypothetical protein